MIQFCSSLSIYAERYGTRAIFTELWVGLEADKIKLLGQKWRSNLIKYLRLHAWLADWPYWLKLAQTENSSINQTAVYNSRNHTTHNALNLFMKQLLYLVTFAWDNIESLVLLFSPKRLVFHKEYFVPWFIKTHSLLAN